jgi:glycogen debranching enzyme
MLAMKQVSDILPRLPRPHEALPLPALALRAVTSKDGKMIYASSDRQFKGAFFTRDALEVAEDLMAIKPKLAKNILLSVARFSGTGNNEMSEEEYGKLSHEYRSVIVDGKPIDKTSQEIFNRLSFKWGGNQQQMVYYGAADTTPHFLRTLGMYCSQQGKAILDLPVTLAQDGKTLPLHMIAERALNWTQQAIADSGSGLLEFQRRNPQSPLNHLWKDSDEFYVHEDGHLANHSQPIASVEVQGTVYDAFLAAGELGLTDKAKSRHAAHAIRDKTLELLWQNDRQYFALGCDYDPVGAVRVITTSTANPAGLLDTRFFDDLPEEKRQQYITGIVKTIFSKDFLTNVGIRSRSLAAAHVIPFWDYHGSYASWPKETYDIAKGLRRQGFPALCEQLENRLLNIVLKTRQYAEFYYVDDHGRILKQSPTGLARKDVFIVDSPNTPESIQAWTVSAIYAITSQRVTQSLKLRKKPANTGWQAVLGRKIMAQIPHVNRLLNPLTLSAQYPTYNYQLSGRKNITY